MAKKAQKVKPLSDEQKKFVERETKILVNDLTFYAKGPVRIQLTGMSGIAFTYGCDDKDRAINVVMNPSILVNIRNEERARMIWRGIGFHELAHHLWPAEAMYKKALKEGFKDLFNLIDDEQNERRGRAKDPTWGACFQTVCAYIFPSKRRRRQDILGIGIEDDGKAQREIPGDMGTYAKRWNEFAFHLRRHLPTDDKTDPLVLEALALIPTRFMDLSKEALFDLTKEIQKVLTRDLILPDPLDPTGKKPQKQKKNEEEEEEEEDEKAEEEEPEAPPATPGVPWWQGLLTSKWSWIALGGFVAVWLAIFLMGGMDFWKMLWSIIVFWAAVVVALGTIFYLMKRARRKALMEALSKGGAPPPPKQPDDETSGSIKVKRCALIGGGWILLLLAWGLVAFGGLWAWRGLWIHALGTVAVGLILVPIARLIIQLGKNFGVKKQPAATPTAKSEEDKIAEKTKGMGFWRRFTWLLTLEWLVPALLALWGLLMLAVSWLGRMFVRNIWRPFWGFVWKFMGWIGNILCFFFGSWIDRIDRAFDSKWWRTTKRATREWWKWAYIAMIRTFIRIWRSWLLRLAILAAPVAAIICVLIAATAQAIELYWWQLLLLILALLLLAILGWLFRKKIKDFLTAEMLADQKLLEMLMQQMPLDKEMLEFNVLRNIQPIQQDPQFLADNLPLVRPLAQELRRSFLNCGHADVEREDRPDGYDLIDDIEQIAMGETEVFIDDERMPKASLHIEIAVDCSSSMDAQTARLKAGGKFLLAKRIALLVEEAAKNQRGITGKFWGFTDSTIYDAGSVGEGRLSGLRCGGGNNDAAALWQMGRSAAGSNKDLRILLMISDGQPSECSWGSLNHLGWKLIREGMIVVQIAVDKIHDPALPWFFVDFHDQEMDMAIANFCRILGRLVES